MKALVFKEVWAQNSLIDGCLRDEGVKANETNSEKTMEYIQINK